MPKALLLENIHPLAANYLRERGFDVVTSTGAMDEDELIAALDDVDLLGVRSKTNVTRRVMEAHPQLSAIGCFSIGTNQVDLDYAASQGIAVFNAPYSNTRSVVELVISDIIALERRVPAHTKSIREGVWSKTAKQSHEVRGKTLGIIGYGNIGTQVSVLAEALGMTVLYYDIEEKLAMGNARRVFEIDDLLRESDVITVHVDGRKSNTNFIDDDKFSKMKQGALFINLSRGFVVDCDALYNHLKSGHLGGAAIDVYPTEPKKIGDPFHTPLAEIDNVVLTPHIGGSTLEAQESIGRYVSHKLYDYWMNGETSLSVNMPTITLKGNTGVTRITHLHENLPGVLAQLNNILSAENINIASQYLATEGELGYVVTDVATHPSEKAISEIKNIKGTIRVHVLD
ncbi:MAG: phosphoglycerate dehydrogenase [Bifidobacteriaceae bacterium]|nr:phosphoglycerate dehydrogenase [Bifidobacteriaceae bacterium]